MAGKVEHLHWCVDKQGQFDNFGLHHFIIELNYENDYKLHKMVKIKL